VTEIRCAVAGFDVKWAFSSPGRPAGFLGSARFDPRTKFGAIWRRERCFHALRHALLPLFGPLLLRPNSCSRAWRGRAQAPIPLPTLRHNNRITSVTIRSHIVGCLFDVWAFFDGIAKGKKRTMKMWDLFDCIQTYKK